MHSRSIRRRLVPLALAAATLALATPVAEAATDGPIVPPKIVVDEGHKVFLVAHADGVQIYRCSPNTAGVLEWTPVAPRATLRDSKEKVIGTHFGGPTWQLKDGSSVVAKRVAGETVDSTAIPWLLLEKVSASAGADGNSLQSTAFIQRTHTTGGLAPAASQCNASTAGTVTEVDYTADYWFWKATGS